MNTELLGVQLLSIYFATRILVCNSSILSSLLKHPFTTVYSTRYMDTEAWTTAFLGFIYQVASRWRLQHLLGATLGADTLAVALLRTVIDPLFLHIEKRDLLDEDKMKQLNKQKDTAERF